MISWLLSLLFPVRRPSALTSEELERTMRLKAERDRSDPFFEHREEGQ
jgi:hypothetical protein